MMTVKTILIPLEGSQSDIPVLLMRSTEVAVAQRTVRRAVP